MELEERLGRSVGLRMDISSHGDGIDPGGWAMTTKRMGGADVRDSPSGCVLDPPQKARELWIATSIAVEPVS